MISFKLALVFRNFSTGFQHFCWLSFLIRLFITVQIKHNICFSVLVVAERQGQRNTFITPVSSLTPASLVVVYISVLDHAEANSTLLLTACSVLLSVFSLRLLTSFLVAILLSSIRSWWLTLSNPRASFGASCCLLSVYVVIALTCKAVFPMRVASDVVFLIAWYLICWPEQFDITVSSVPAPFLATS